MSLLFIAPDRDMQRWRNAILEVDPDIDVEIWPEVQSTDRVQFIVSWRHPSRVLQQYPHLKAVSSLGAGVNHILTDDSLPPSIPICRVVSPSLAQQMKEYVFAAILNHHRNIYDYKKQNDAGDWNELQHSSGKDIAVGVMGLGALGRPIAESLAQFGYSVAGWARSAKHIPGVEPYAGPDELTPFLNRTEILVCVLPLTDGTNGILDLELFRKMKHPGYIINVARGDHLVEEDLIYALDKGWLAGACLDVFSEEPLPEKHAFWGRPNIQITPHVCGISQPKEVAAQLVDNYKRVLSGMAPQHTVSRNRGY